MNHVLTFLTKLLLGIIFLSPCSMMAQEEIFHQCSHQQKRILPFGAVYQKRIQEEGSLFREVSGEAGFTYSGVSFGHAWTDIDLDGYPDLFCTGHGKAQLYMNQKDGTFRVTDIPFYKINDTIDGEVIPKAYYDMHGATFTDINHDGYPDLYIQLGGDMGRTSGKQNLLFLNDNGTLIFENRAAEYLLQDSLGRGRSTLFFDQNKDGYVDFINSNFDRGDKLYSTSLYTYDSGNEYFSRSQDFGLDVTSLRGTTLIQTRIESVQHVVAVTDLEDRMDVYDYVRIPFRTVASKKHFGIRDVAVADFNGDGFQDIFTVSNRYASEATLLNDTTLLVYLYSGAKKVGYNDENKVSFKTAGEITIDSKIYPYKGGIAKYWRIGRNSYHPDTDVFSLNAEDSKNHNFSPLCLLCLGVNIGYNTQDQKWEVFNTDPIDNLQSAIKITSTKPFEDIRTYNFQRSDLLSSDKLFLSLNNGGFQEAADFLLNDQNISTGVSVVAADFDNDMDEDLLISCQGAAVNYPNRYYENDGTGKFRLIENFGATSAIGGRSGSVSAADFDNDGFLDVFAENGEGLIGEGAVPLSFNDGPYRLYKNKGNQNHWVKFRIYDEQSKGNKLAIGTTIYCYAGGKKQVRLKGAESHIYAQNDPTIHFGLGRNDMIDSVEVFWPGGGKSIHYNVSADSMYLITSREVTVGNGKVNESPSKKECNGVVYPNPVSDYVLISKENTIKRIESINIYNYMGKNVYTETVRGRYEASPVSINGWSNGNYVLKIEYEDKNYCYLRFQVIK